MTNRVNFDANGGTVSPDFKWVTYDSAYGELPTPELEGHTFAGWWTTKSGGTKVELTTIVTNKNTHTLYAQWMPNTYKVTFNANGGTPETTSGDVTYDNQYGTLPEPTRTGYTFVGWFTDVTNGVEVTKETTVAITDAQTLYAHWDPNTYTVVYDANGGDGEMPAEAFTYDQTTNLQENVFASGALQYDFLGWATNKVSPPALESDVIYTNRAIVLNLTAEANATSTLYAVWGAPSSDLSRAADCNNLKLLSTNTSESATCWTVDHTTGYEGTSSVHASGDKKVSMTATITGTGVLSFKFKIKINGKPSARVILQFKGFKGGYALIYDDSGMVDNEWHDGPYDYLTGGIQYSEGRFVKSDPETEEVEWMYMGENGECWIDQVKWIPDGGGRSVEFDTGVAMDETSNRSTIFSGSSRYARATSSETPHSPVYGFISKLTSTR